MLRRSSFTLLVLALVLGCSSATPSRRPVPPPAGQQPAEAPLPPPDDGLNATVWANLSLEHDLAYLEIYRAAERWLEAALADPTWDALPVGDRDPQEPFGELPPAVILDVDETVLDNAGYQTELILTGREYDDESWATWCERRIATALPGALEFTRRAAAEGIAVFYLTNRARELGPATLDNLRQLGFPSANEASFLGLGTDVPGCVQVGSSKGCRRRLVGRSHRVLMQVGDQLGDFVDPAENTLAGRARAVEPYTSWIGERWWVLPNPTYGSWEAAAFGNQWKLPRAERRRLKIEALEAN